MTWNPSNPITANLLDFQLPPRFFIEQDETTVDDRAGWATPRKRPRRVHKKLAKRAFQAHCRAPVIGVRAWEVQKRRWHGMAPKLAVWLRGSDPAGFVWESASIEIEPVMFDGKTITKANVPDSVLASGRMLVRQHAEAPEVSLAPAAEVHSEPAPVEWTGHRGWLDTKVQARTITTRAVVFTPPSVNHLPPVVAQKIERVATFVARAMLSAAHGEHRSTVIARQTSYRPGPGDQLSRMLGSR